MQNPNEDTEWNDALRQHNIIPPKDEKTITESDVVNVVDSVVSAKLDGVVSKGLGDLTLEELDLIEDEEDERVLLEFRRRRLNEMKEAAQRSKFGDVLEIRGEDYIQEVNKAGDGIWVVLHLYEMGIPLCTLINQFILQLAQKFPSTKFIKSISTLCIKNYPEQNVPTVFVYFEGTMKKQFIGPHAFGGMKLKLEELEWMLSETGAVKTDIEEDPRKKVQDVMFSSLKNTAKKGSDENSDDENDW